MAALEEISAFLVSQKPHLARLGIKEIGVFGSYVRGDQNSDSDVVIKSNLRPFLRERILAEVVYL